MNTNALHNVMNLVLAILAGIEGFNWYVLFSPDTSLKVAASIGLAKLVINVWRDGPLGLFKPQPPVVATKE